MKRECCEICLSKSMKEFHKRLFAYLSRSNKIGSNIHVLTTTQSSVFSLDDFSKAKILPKQHTSVDQLEPHLPSNRLVTDSCTLCIVQFTPDNFL